MTDPTIPFNDLARGTRVLRSALDEAIAEVVQSGWYVLGPQHNAFEEELAEFLGTSHALGVGNGTDALQIALSALGIRPGQTVLTAANAGGYTSTATRSLGARPVYADVDPSSLLLTEGSVRSTLDELPEPPAAIVVTHLYGAAVDLYPIMELARDRGIPVVEDCAQALGAYVGDARVGSIGDISTTSFYPTKNLGALGDGGAVMTSNEELAASVRQLRQYGWSTKYRATLQGGRNSRLDELQAAVLRVKLTHLDSWNERRREIHAVYEAAAGGQVRTVNAAGPAFVGHLAVLDVEDRDGAQDHFRDARIQTDVHYPIPDHQQPISVEGLVVPLPHTEQAARRTLSVPLFPELTDEEVGRVATAISGLR